jgi:hypothetical protein
LIEASKFPLSATEIPEGEVANGALANDIVCWLNYLRKENKKINRVPYLTFPAGSANAT